MTPSEEQENPMLSVIRSKGQAWLASACGYSLNWHSAGRSLALAPAGPFRAALKEYRAAATKAGLEDAGMELEEEAGAEEAPDRFVPVQEDPVWGDRATELVLIGVRLQKERVRALLDAALVTEAEFAKAT